MTHTLPVDELWIAYGTGKRLRYIAVHSIALLIEREKAQALPLFHATAGCDTVSRKLHGSLERVPGATLSVLLGMCRWPLRTPTPSILQPTIDPILVTFGQMSL